MSASAPREKILSRRLKGILQQGSRADQPVLQVSRGAVGAPGVAQEHTALSWHDTCVYGGCAGDVVAGDGIATSEGEIRGGTSVCQGTSTLSGQIRRLWTRAGLDRLVALLLRFTTGRGETSLWIAPLVLKCLDLLAPLLVLRITAAHTRALALNIERRNVFHAARPAILARVRWSKDWRRVEKAT